MVWWSLGSFAMPTISRERIKDELCVGGKTWEHVELSVLLQRKLQDDTNHGIRLVGVPDAGRTHTHMV